jgi:hypothetical protein
MQGKTFILSDTDFRILFPTLLIQITIQSWYMNGLLRDDLSTDNGIILSTAERWVLMVDPQVR